MSVLFVVDIDGTISNGEARFKEAGPEPLRHNKIVYDAWVGIVNRNMQYDKPVLGMRELCWAMSVESTMLYLTSREDKHLEDTQEWLSQNGFPTGPQLIMRPMDNYDDGAVFKEKMVKLALMRYGIRTVVMIDDDGQGDIEVMCAKNGWTFLKARSGGQR